MKILTQLTGIVIASAFAIIGLSLVKSWESVFAVAFCILAVETMRIIINDIAKEVKNNGTK